MKAWNGAIAVWNGAIPAWRGAIPAWRGAIPVRGGAIPAWGGAAQAWGGAAQVWGGVAQAWRGAIPALILEITNDNNLRIEGISTFKNLIFEILLTIIFLNNILNIKFYRIEKYFNS